MGVWALGELDVGFREFHAIDLFYCLGLTRGFENSCTGKWLSLCALASF